MNGCTWCGTTDPEVMRASPFPDFCGDACSRMYCEDLRRQVREALAPGQPRQALVDVIARAGWDAARFGGCARMGDERTGDE